MKLSGKQFEKLQNALLSAFPWLEELERMARFKLDVRLQQVADGNLSNQVFRLIEWMEARGRVPELVLGARQSNPGNLDLFDVAQELKLAISDVPASQRLQRLIREQNSMLDVNRWRTMLAKVEFQVCRVEVKLNNHKFVYGTGFLIGKNVVITNYHVMKQVIEKDQSKSKGQNWAEPSDVILRFDLKVIDDNNTVSQGTIYHLDAEKPVIDSSFPSPHDGELKPSGLPNTNQLDYAFLRVDGCPGDETIGKSDPGAPKRGWIKVSQKFYEFPPDSALLIVQHPRAAALKLAIDTQAILGLNDNGTRVRYRTNTEPGSSGSPCFNIDWELVALHHAGDPDYSIGHQPEYNQGIPFSAIYGLMKKRNLIDEIQN